eukprot:gnl/MRDRNA2_/MRDRNA2_207831_c0_seq1.p2 gnl/MRDRNA2_/MRDRNA2_207831_c0~~gnl/MRDRNA2_/MRDRNA2_207831_c0_seq1.p2  ORF type:complete len:102 (+),score=13.77 gnl/MRDRNA2_/MRDRNA2_207831_c0_seq1:38-307(+)
MSSSSWSAVLSEPTVVDASASAATSQGFSPSVICVPCTASATAMLADISSTHKVGVTFFHDVHLLPVPFSQGAFGDPSQRLGNTVFSLG